MELRHLRYFVAVAEHLHFGRAARQLRMTQPPLSQQIRRLENELEVQLFRRTRRHVELTYAGRVFLKQAREVLAQVEQAVLAARRANRGEIGELAVGFVGSATYHILPLIVSAFRRRFPTVHVTLRELVPADQVEALQAGKIQLGFFRAPTEEDGLSFEPVFREPLVAALPESHRLSAQARIRLASLAREAFVSFPRPLGPGYYDLLVSLCRQAGFSPDIVQEASGMETLVSLVAAGIGVALVPASCQNFRRVGVVYKPIMRPCPMVEMAVVWRRDEDSPVLRAFLNVLRQVKAERGAAKFGAEPS